MLTDLAVKHCVPCAGGVPPLAKEEIEMYLAQLVTPWDVVDSKKLEKDFSFINFKEALVFVNKAGEIAEAEGHHPDIYLHNWRKVRIEIMTHKIKGLTESDFILAAKIDTLG